jgi:transposase-like protein
MAEAALVAVEPTHTGKYKRLTSTDKAFALRYHADGLTQVQIAQRLGCTQSAISQWLSACQDTTAEAGLYLRGQALPMAEKVVKKGRPSDLIKALQGVSVLAEERSAGLVIQIGGGQGDVKVAVMTTFAPVNESASQVNISSIIRTEEMANPSND